MPRWLPLVLLLLLACSAPEESSQGAADEFKPIDPCRHLEDPAGWVHEGAVSALQDQMPSLCACFREDAEGVRLYVAAYLKVDGTVQVDLLGHRSTVADQVQCFQERTQKALQNWVDLGGGWFDGNVYLESEPVAYSWDGMSCAAAEADLPLNGPELSADYLEANPKGLLFPAEMPPEHCYERVRRHVRINFPMEVRTPKPACKNAWHPLGCPDVKK